MTTTERPDQLERLLNAERMVAEISLLLLRETNYQRALREACRILGEATGVSRVYIFENFAGNTRCCNTVEWVADAITPVQQDLQDVAYESIRYWQITLEGGENIRADDIHTLPDAVVDILEWQGIQSLLAVPLRVFDRWAGFLGFDVCGRQRAWSDDDVATIETVARIFSTVLEKRELEQQLAHSGRLSAVGSLAAGVAHEYNNLLAGIMGLIELSLEDSLLSPTTRKDLERVLGLIDRGVNLTRKLLNISRQNTATEKVDLRDIVDDCLSLLGKSLRTERVDVDFKVQGTQTWVEGNPGELSQVVLNLLINATEAMQGPSLRRLSVELRGRSNNNVVLEIEDSGPGIPEAMLTAIFEPFVTTKGKLGGGNKESTGLGLSIASRIATQHDGKLTARNSARAGAVFTLELPAVEPPGPHERKGPERVITAGITGRIAIIDDEPDIVDVLRRFLVSQGHHVETFTTANPAIRALHKRLFDLCLVDLVMPDDGARSYLEAIKALAPEKRPAVILMSGRSEAEAMARVSDLPWDEFLAKPFPNLLAAGALVARLLNDRRPPPPD